MIRVQLEKTKVTIAHYALVAYKWYTMKNQLWRGEKEMGEPAVSEHTHYLGLQDQLRLEASTHPRVTFPQLP